MEDFRDKIEASDSKFLRFLTKVIPGYGGYRDKELRREADRMLRECVMARLRPAAASLNDLRTQFHPINQGKLLLLAEGLSSKIMLLVDKLRYADYGYSGAFAAVKIDAAKLDQIYMFDETLVTRAEAIAEAVKGAPGDPEGAMAKVQTAITEFESALSERERIFREG